MNITPSDHLKSLLNTGQKQEKGSLEAAADKLLSLPRSAFYW